MNVVMFRSKNILLRTFERLKIANGSPKNPVAKRGETQRIYFQAS